MSEQDDEGGRGFRKLIRESKEEAFHARRALRRELPNPSTATKVEVASALADYRDLLSDYKGEGSLKTPWDEREVNVDEVDVMLSRTVEEEETLNRRGAPTRTRQVPLVARVPAGHLFAIGKELDAVAKELGFAAAAKEQTDNTDASHEDLAGLLKARGQDEALENLPDSWTADDADAEGEV